MSKETVEVQVEQEETKVTKVNTKAKKVELEVIAENEVLMPIFTVIPVTKGLVATKVSVENIGGGDLYVGVGEVDIKQDFFLPQGEVREFETDVLLYSASRPTALIKYLR